MPDHMVCRNHKRVKCEYSTRRYGKLSAAHFEARRGALAPKEKDMALEC
jgi:hypothetical protein